MKHLPQFLSILLIATTPSLGRPSQAVEPRQLTYCELSRDPAAYNHQLVRLTAFVTHGFEDFQIAEPDCPTQGFSTWLMYGGKAQSGTMYCCPGEGSRDTRNEPLEVEGIQVSLLEDRIFQQFTELLKKERNTTLRATVVGAFFSGEKESVSGSTRWRGFGHMGCCSLLVIQQIESFEPHKRTDLDYTAEAGWYENEGCNWDTEQYRRHVSVSNRDGSAQTAIAEQRAADGGHTWAFNDPERVASESLKPLYPVQIPVLKRVSNAPSRQVFRWRNGKKSVTVVVTRPYWLSFYAASEHVAWVSTMIKEVACN